MSKRPIFAILLALTVTVPAPARAADEKTPKSDKPAVILRFASLDHLRGDFRYLGEVVGEAEKAKQLDELIKSKLGEQGLQGIDTKKPIGAYGWVGSAGIDSKVVFMLPIADQKAFLTLLSDTLDIKPEKGEDGVYETDVEQVRAKVYFRFANGYAYITALDKDVLVKDRLLAPAAVLPAGQTGALSVLVNIDLIPDNLKELALGTIENRVADLKDKEMPGHTEAQKKLHDAAIDELGAQIKSLLKHGGETALRLDLDRKAGELSLTASVAGKSGSPLADAIRNLGQIQSATAALLLPHAAIKSELNLSLPEKLRPLMGPALKDAEKQTLAKAKNKDEREVTKSLLEAIMPTLKAAELDLAFTLLGPGNDGLYHFLGGAKVKNGAKLEASFRNVAAKAPKEIKLDVEKVGDVNIHQLQAGKGKLDDPSTRRAFGDNPPLYLAFRDNLLLVAGGTKGLSTLKEALSATPKPGKVVELQVAMARLIPFFEDTKQKEAARKVFGDDKDGGRVRLTVEGGKALTLRLVVEAKLFDFVNRVEKAKKE